MANLALEIRRPADVDFKEAVLDGLRAVGGERVRKNHSIKTLSGRIYKVPAVILDRQRSRPLAFVSAVQNRASIPAHLTELFDLKNAFDDVDRKAIHDENADLQKEDKHLMGQVSEIVPFAQATLKLRGILNA